MGRIEKQKLNEKIKKKADELVDAAEKIGSLNFFEISIKHVNGELITSLETKYKEKV
ncbi:hypothetical protein [Clostridium sp. BSD9I1]|uniref:hypothetical protein n=1 Tax=Clostridium sp. BSD9I1 TaxID=2003589 RepID=UPI0016454FC7|nr:hypothetical protein [Clostridium sp. BSD9I1]